MLLLAAARFAVSAHSHEPPQSICCLRWYIILRVIEPLAVFGENQIGRVAAEEETCWDNGFSRWG